MRRKALIVGIDSYGGGNDLKVCVADAQAMHRVLSFHKGDEGERNFFCTLLPGHMGDGSPIKRSGLMEALENLFQYDGEVLLYFSGHGYLSTTGGVLCTSDWTRDNGGVHMQDVMELAFRSQAHQILILLDCCHGGDLGNPAIWNRNSEANPLATIRENMTVIAASRGSEEALEGEEHSLFTAALLDALDGGAADHLGFVTAPALYAYVSRRFTDKDYQRPVYKTNATDVLSVRVCEPLIEQKKLRLLPGLFPTPDHKYPLDPEYDPEDEYGNVREPVNHDKVAIAQLFKSYRDAGLLRSSDPELQLFWVAQRGKTVELTQHGKEYWWLLVNDKL
jgi:hypothetical protein